jgi:hypothetical protein
VVREAMNYIVNLCNNAPNNKGLVATEGSDGSLHNLRPKDVDINVIVERELMGGKIARHNAIVEQNGFIFESVEKFIFIMAVIRSINLKRIDCKDEYMYIITEFGQTLLYKLRSTINRLILINVARDGLKPVEK